MTSLYIDGLSAPDEIKDSLKELSKTYSFGKEVTKGANGYLYFGKNRIMDTEVAVKFYYWGSDKAYHAEPRNLATIESDNILSIYDASLIDNDWAYFVTPFCQHGDLDNYIESTAFGNIGAIDLIGGVLSGLSHLHGAKFLHRDLKPSNIYLDDNLNAVIGDFGSVTLLPDGELEVPASSHSIIYRPPEAITTNMYGCRGDIYQVGIVLYQLLGGLLPYDELAWMSKSELKHYNKLTDQADRSIYADQCIKNKITRGKVINLKSLPPWVPDSLIRIIRKSTQIDPSKRYSTVTAFKAELHKVRSSTLDWKIEDGCPTLNSGTSFRISDNNGQYTVHKKKTGDWRADKSFKSMDLKGLVLEINKKA